MPTDTVEESPRPVLVQEKRRSRKRAATVQAVIETPPLDAAGAGETPPAAQAGASLYGKPATGEPDHSLVPPPPKKLLEPADFFRYWRSIPERERSAWCIAYAYRKLPVCDELQPLTMEEIREIERKQRKQPERNCGKLTEPFDPDNWEQDVYQWKGAGDYVIRLNDQHPSVKKTICETHIRGLRDWSNFPPILDLEQVVLEEPLNQPYLRWARTHGIKFPGDPGAIETDDVQQENEDMAANIAVEKLTDALVDATRRQPQAAAPAADTNAAAEAVRATTTAFQNTSKVMIEMVQDANKAKAKAEDPMEFHTRVMETAKALQQPAPAAAGPSLTELMAVLNGMMAPMIASQNAILAEVRSRAEAAERRAEAAELRAQTIAHPPAAAAPEPVNPVKSALELIKGLATLRDAASPILGGDAADGMPTWARLTDKALDALPNLVHNIAVLRTGQGTAELPPELEVTDDEPAKPDATPQLDTKEDKPEMFSNRKIAETLAKPLIDSLNRGDHGFQFAAGMILEPRIMGFPGSVVYEMALSKGRDGMYAILQSYPELWQKLTQIPKKFEVYLTEFLDAATARAIAAESARPAPQQPPAAAPAAQPEVLPKPNGAPAAPTTKGRVIIGPGGQPTQTA